MYCRKCGKALADSAKFCKYCGMQVSSVSRQSEHIVENIKPERKKRRGWLLLIVIVLFLMIGGGVFVYFGTDILQGIRKSEPEKVQEDIAFHETETDFEETGSIKEQERRTEKTEAADEEEKVSPEEQVDQSPILQTEPVEEPGQDEEEEMDREYILPESDSVFLSMEDLEGLSAEECRLARNEIYARHGRLFTDEMLQEYFDSLDWYEGTVEADEFNDSVLNEYETANRDLIVLYEKEQGYR